MMRQSKALAIALGASLAACHSAFGLDEVERVHEVDVQYAMHEVRNDVTGAPTIEIVDRDPQLTVELADRSMPPLLKFPDHTVRFRRESDEQAYHVVVTPLDPRDPLTEYQFSTPVLRITDRVVGRARRDDPDAGVTVTQSVPNAPDGTDSSLTTTGLWTQTRHSDGAAGNTNQMFTFEWRGAGSRAGRHGRLDPRLHDRAYAISTWRQAVSGARSYSVLTHACENPLAPDDIFGLFSVEVACQVAAVARDRCTYVRTSFAQEDARIALAVPPGIAHPNVFQAWAVSAIPAPNLLLRGELTLANFLAVRPATEAAVEWNDAIDYANPYPDHAVAVSASTGRLRLVSLGSEPGATPMTLETRTLYFTPADGCSLVSEPLRPIEIAGGATLAGTPLDVDEVRVAIDTNLDVQLSWTDAAPGAADVYAVTLYRVVPFFGRVWRLPVRIFVAADRTIAIAPSLFGPGIAYVFEIETIVGFPVAATGDLDTFGYPALPYASSTAWTSTFLLQ